MRKNLTTTLLLTLNYAVNLTTQDHDQDMATSNSPIYEPITPLCNSKNDAWNGLTRVHLKRPELDGNALLEGTRIFSLELDEETTIAKISRGFDNLATNNGSHSKF